MTSAIPTSTQSFRELVVDSALDVHAVVGVDGVYRFVSPACSRLFGWDAASVVGVSQVSLAHPDDAETIENAHRQILYGPSGAVTAEWRVRCADGRYRWTETASRSFVDDGEPVVVSTIRDIDARRRSAGDLHRLAMTDPLTGIANRSVFMDRLHQAMSRLERRSGMVVVLFVDLDHFKEVNDTAGHLAGDAVLIQTVSRLQRLLRPHDTLARLGGDELAIIIEDLTTVDEIGELASRIVTGQHQPFSIGERSLRSTISVGIATTDNNRHDAESLLQEADMALYQAKHRGRDRFELFDTALRSEELGRARAERELREALDHGGLYLEYQPIVDLRSGAVVAAEALVRISRPESPALLDPNTLIEVVERSGLVDLIDQWVINEASHQLATWHADFQGSTIPALVVNLSTRSIADPRFAETTAARLNGSGIPAGMLQIDVTEHALLSSSGGAGASLVALRDNGVVIGLDGFGTGYSSLSHLRLFPLDQVKIHPSLVQALDRGGADGALVRAIVDLCHGLGLRAVATGIETRSQLEHATTLGFDQGQGCHIGQPGPGSMIEERILERAMPRIG